MNTITNEFFTMRKRHQKAFSSAEQAVDDMLRILSDITDLVNRRDENGSIDTFMEQQHQPEDPSKTSLPPSPTREAQPQDEGASTNTADGRTDDPMVVDKRPADTSIDAPDEAIVGLLQNLLSKSKSLQSSLVSDHKSVGTAMNKFGKAIDTATATNLGELCAPGVRLSTAKINDAIATHLFREGMFDVGRSFLCEAGVQLDDDNIRPFEQLYRILTAFRRDDLTPAIEWTREKRQFLRESASNLEFRLHCLAYLQVLQAGDRDAALKYARTHLSSFPEHITHVQKLMTCLLYSSSLQSSPYKALVHPSRRDDIERCLSREYCRAQGLTKDSLLLTVVRCGTKAIPMLLKATRVASNLHELGIDDALPVEIDVGRDCYFHSIFTCPVSKEEASDGNNVPMILPCGHVLSKQSIMRLPRGTSRFKCPYCPMEQVIAECRELHI